MAVWASGGLEAGDGAALQPLTQLVDALSGVGAHGLTIVAVLQVETAEPIACEAARRVQKRCKMSWGDDMKSEQAAHLRLLSLLCGAVGSAPPSGQLGVR